MATSEIAPGVHRLGSKWINWYLVVEGDRVTLVDTGISGYYDQLEPALRAAGRTLGDIEAVVLTHHHTDHLGCAERIRIETGARVLGPASEAAYIRGEEKQPQPNGIASNVWRPALIGFLAHALRNGGASVDHVAELATYGDGETLDVPGRLRTISTPGHSAGHHSLHLADRGVLFAGDALATVSWTTGTTEPQLHPFGEDRARMPAALDALEPVDAGLVTFGHGEPFRGSPAEAVARARTLDADAKIR